MTDDDELVIHDGRQSETAASVQRGVCRMLYHAGHVSVPEFQLSTGRRADILSLDGKGNIWIVEIKSSLADFQADNKWHEYAEFCDQLYFAHPTFLEAEIFPEQTGLIVADSYGAEITRQPQTHRLNAARRKALTLSIARTAALRLQKVYDPAI